MVGVKFFKPQSKENISDDNYVTNLQSASWHNVATFRLCCARILLGIVLQAHKVKRADPLMKNT